MTLPGTGVALTVFREMAGALGIDATFSLGTPRKKPICASWPGTFCRKRGSLALNWLSAVRWGERTFPAWVTYFAGSRASAPTSSAESARNDIVKSAKSAARNSFPEKFGLPPKAQVRATLLMNGGTAVASRARPSR